MQLASYLAIAAGIVVEILLLWETADRQKNPHPVPGLLATRLGRIQEIIALALAAFWALILLAEWLQPQLSSQAYDFLGNAVMGPSFFFLFVFGMVVPRLLPRVNEQTIFIVNLVVLSTLPGGLDWLWLALLALPTLGVLIAAFTHRRPSPALQSLLYFWYLVCLLIMAVQNDYQTFFAPPAELQMTSLDYFIAGAVGIFLLLHSIFLARFFLMLSANLLPQNRYLLALAMPKLFDDQQMPRRKFFIILGLVLLVTLINRLSGLFPSASLLNALLLISVHFIDRPFRFDQRI